MTRTLKERACLPFGCLSLYWCFTAITSMMLILTTLYASKATFATNIRMVSRSSSNAILTLKVLSQSTGLMLAACVLAAFETIQWITIMKGHGMILASFLAIQANTGPLGLLSLICGRRVALSARVWSLLKFSSALLVWGLDLIIFADVSTNIGFTTIATTTIPWSTDMNSFNYTIASRWKGQINYVFPPDFPHFISDGSLAVDITPKQRPDPSCSQGTNIRGERLCNRVVYIPGSIEIFQGGLELKGTANIADAYVIPNQRGYILNFTETTPSRKFDTSDCRIYTFNGAAVRMCFDNEPNAATINAEISWCPLSLVTAAQCKSNESWLTSSASTTSFTTSFRESETAYSRLNGSILSSHFTNKASLASVNASDLRHAFDIFFTDTGSNDPVKLALSNSKELPGNEFIAFLTGQFVGFDTFSKAGIAAADTQGTTALQALIAITLYKCQQDLFERIYAAVPDLLNITNPSSTPGQLDVPGFVTDAIGMLGDMIDSFKLKSRSENTVSTPGGYRNTSTTIRLARISYQLVVGRNYVISYAVLAATVLLLCVMALTWNSVCFKKREIQTTSFPFLDCWANCAIVTASEETVKQSDLDTVRKRGTYKMMEQLGPMTIKNVSG